MKQKKPELLAPAGSIDALFGAIEGGADAVYVGGVAFNARMNAKNFTSEELKRGIDTAHAYGAKVYIAANTLIYQRELDDYLRAAEEAYLLGADALIVADLGAARLLKERIPIELHGSTQLSGHDVHAARLLAKAGFSRMVLAREMDRENIRYFTENSPIEAEVFVHGALCVCHSGQCLFSSAVGGRSGNRGECAQPCRLPYFTPKGKTDYPLSLSDLSLARHIPELCDMGVASFKIEGRMKSPEYVRDVTSVWRRLIDLGKGADARDMEELAAVFSRGGFTDGYYRGNIGSAMLGVRSEKDKERTRQLTPFDGIKRKIPIELEARIARGERISLKIKKGADTVLAEGEIPQEARTAPLERERVLQSLMKLGGTPYEAADVRLELDEGLMLPISALNALRREAIDKLSALYSVIRSEEDIVKRSKNAPKNAIGTREEKKSAVFFMPKNICSEAVEFFDIIYIPVEKYNEFSRSTEFSVFAESRDKLGIFLPPVIFDSEKKDIAEMVDFAAEDGVKHILVGNIGHLELAKRSGMTLHGDFRLNISNGYAVGYAEELGFEDVIVSPELTLPRIRDIGGRTYAVVYGRLPLMVTEKCVGKELGGCEDCNGGRLSLKDRRGKSFPVLKAYRHRSVILNSVPFYMADREDELRKNRVCMRHFIFTVESKQQVAQVIANHKKFLPPADPASVKRIK